MLSRPPSRCDLEHRNKESCQFKNVFCAICYEFAVSTVLTVFLNKRLRKPNCQPHQELTIQRNWQHWIHKKQDEENQAKKQTMYYNDGGGGGGGEPRRLRRKSSLTHKFYKFINFSNM